MLTGGMMLPRRLALYAYPTAATDWQALAQAAAGHGWPDPVIYDDSPHPGGHRGFA